MANGRPKLYFSLFYNFVYFFLNRNAPAITMLNVASIIVIIVVIDGSGCVVVLEGVGADSDGEGVIWGDIVGLAGIVGEGDGRGVA